MLIGLLQTGEVDPELCAAHGRYPPMFERLFAAADPTIRLRVYPVLDGVLPERVDACDAWLVTGSKSGVYDPDPWIPPLKRFLAAAYAAEAPIIGVCFGHQILAEALGGRAEKSPKGWGVGLHDYAVVAPEGADMIAATGETIRLRAIHQDQVVAAPPGATLLARSDFCAFAALGYGDPTDPVAISLQPHPEFDAEFVSALVRLRRGTTIDAALADAALASFPQRADMAKTAAWFARFLRRRVGAAFS